MRLTRRALLLGGAAGAATAGAVGYAFAQRPSAVEAPTSLKVDATPIESFSASDRERRRFGALTYRSGLELRADLEGFGGLSGLWRSPDGGRLVAITDNAQWLTARIDRREGRLVGLSDAVMAPILTATGKPLRRSRFYDTEGLAIAGDTAWVSVERSHALFRFDWGRSGVQSRGQPIPLPRQVRDLPSNSGLEAVAVAPARSPLAGALVAVAERSQSGSTAPTLGLILTGPRPGAFELVRADDYDVTDIAFLPNGEVLVLERRFSLLGGLGIRIRRLDASAIRPGALANGPVIFETDGSSQIDNMEGMALHREGSEVVVTLIADNNFSRMQRTLLLEFMLAE